MLTEIAIIYLGLSIHSYIISSNSYKHHMREHYFLFFITASRSKLEISEWNVTQTVYFQSKSQIILEILTQGAFIFFSSYQRKKTR